MDVRPSPQRPPASCPGCRCLARHARSQSLLKSTLVARPKMHRRMFHMTPALRMLGVAALAAWIEGCATPSASHKATLPCPCPNPPPTPGCQCVVPPPPPGVWTRCPAFRPAEVWSPTPVYSPLGSKFTFFADVAGDGHAAAVAVKTPSVFKGADLVVRRVEGRSFGPSETWLASFPVGDIDIFFADADGDGRADAIVVARHFITVGRSTGEFFLRGTQSWAWAPVRMSGELGTYFADVNGDGKADAIHVNVSNISVQLSDGKKFGPPQVWSSESFYGEVGTFFVDVTGDGKADAVIVNHADIRVRPSDGTSFVAQESVWSSSFEGEPDTYFADVDGDGRADAIAVTKAGIWVKRSTGIGFSNAEDWTGGLPFFGELATFFADVNADGAADAIAVNSSDVLVRLSKAGELCVAPEKTQ